MAGSSKKEASPFSLAKLSGDAAHWTTYDGACTSCRARKIRCGREKPQCSGCCRDQIECVYSSAPKRVNHVKVLSQNFDDIQDRLIMMQEELSWLTATLKKSNIAGQLEPEPEPERDRPSVEVCDIPARPAPAGHVVRDDGTQIERYHGPWTLLALCRDFGAKIAFHTSESNDKVVGGLVERMLLDLTRTDDDSLHLGVRPGQPDTPICLPPRQLLSIMLDSFLKQADYSTNIFSRQTIYEAVERVYKEPSSPASEPWALCFNLIILLTLGAEHPVRSDDTFARPMLQAVYATARKPSCFMSPRLVNVQALALLSLLVQQYHIDNKTLGDSFFAHACILARESGLSQADQSLLPGSNLTAVEVEERQKVFRSLFIRDRYSGTARGAPTWLPNAGPEDPPPSSTSTVYRQGSTRSHSSDPQHKPHWELAEMQDKLHRFLHSTDAPPMSTSERRTTLARLQQNLETWKQTHKVPSSNRPTTVDEISLHLAFLGTRIRVLDSDDIVGAARSQVIDDARLSCLLVATSCNHNCDQALVNRLYHLLHKAGLTGGVGTHLASTPSLLTSNSSPFSVTSSSAADVPPQNGPQTTPLSASSLGQASFSAPLSFHRLESVFPIAAVFVLARHILGKDQRAWSSQSATTAAPNDENRQHEIDQDILLLEATLLCFGSTASSTVEVAHGQVNSNTHGSKLGRTIQHLVDVIRAIVGPNGRSGLDDADGEGDDDLYASEPLPASTSSLLLDACSNVMSMPNFDLYDSGGVFPMQPSMPQTASSSRSTRAPSQDSISSPATPLWTPQSSLYAPSMTPMATMLPDTPFDISQFLDQMSASSPGIWDNGLRQAGLQMQVQQVQQQQQQAQCIPETTSKRSRKRPRKNV